MILSTAQNYQLRPHLSLHHKNPVVIALGENDEALCYMASLVADDEGGYAVHFMASSLVLDRVRLHGAQRVFVCLDGELWARGELGFAQKKSKMAGSDDGAVALSLQIFGQASPRGDLDQGINPRT